ncbi:Holliday junction resolvase RecU [Mycoplasmopsis bovis]|uniref:Holliday junction resolvase RecU n=1 Tax=Mycoplasmopsis bovis TaxID=28903 RepID=A0A2N8U2X3_MYCBV|nr:Holliday junction resolvase RecU [Mycoplasmopsis bovis]AXJ68332.1 Holliday junction resolvase RecU [Mycoplasmopsis bovis]AXJ74001.1 Holliday junction resolvase RecU [Mycoplasmopsis bovis]MBT1315626.1 Holliday junction resolvase RecU [Mycoplasmopsis bovis]MBT1316097.1 Holliday junction resolvase RecU [Mycoplasmopsis bovis]MBT1316563.1 Holliday junction resolvase RecU [Mycoplasmopsis bovis]
MYKNRGMLLETIINQTIDYYTYNHIAFIEKKGLPIKFSNITSKENKLLLFNAFVYKRSTVDYIGCYKGRFIAFEAKSTNESFLASGNIKEHQKNYLKEIDKNGGIAFLIVFFGLYDEFYLLMYSDFMKIESKNQYRYEWIKKIGKRIPLTFPGIIDFLPYIDF